MTHEISKASTAMPTLVDPDSHTIDRAVEASLPPHVRSCLSPRWTNGYVDFLGFDIVGKMSLDDARAALAIIEATLPTSPQDLIIAELSRVLLVTKAKSGAEADLRARITIFADELSIYPPDAVITACRKWARTNPFTPALSELIDLCERAAERRLGLRAALQRVIAWDRYRK